MQIFTLLAWATVLTGLVSAENVQSGLWTNPPKKPSDASELHFLGSHQEAYGPFCLIARDLTYEYLNSQHFGDITSSIINLLFSHLDRIGLDSYTFNRKQMDRFLLFTSDDSVLPSLPIDPITQAPLQKKYTFIALYSAIAATKTEESKAVLDKLELYFKVFNPTKIQENILKACKDINKLKSTFLLNYEQFLGLKKTTSKLRNDNGLESVRCSTTRRVLRLNNLCRFAVDAASVEAELTYEPIV